MFVKQAYERRLKKQISKYQVGTKTKPAKIGSIRNDKLNYQKQQQFFSKEDIPAHVRTIKEQINHLIDPDHLGLRKKKWNGSVSVPKNFQKQQTHQQKLLKIKLGFTDNPIPKYKEPVIYEGTDTRDDYTNWNVSNQIITKMVRDDLLKKTHNAFENTKNRQEKLLKDYKNPLSKTTTFIQAAKLKVESEADMRQRLRQNYLFNNPTASMEKTNAAIHRLAYQTVVKQKRDELAGRAMKTDFRANMSLTQKGKISVEYKHTGVWQKFGEGDDAYWAWSCCMNQEKDNRGCNVALKDGNCWNLSSFNNQ